MPVGPFGGASLEHPFGITPGLGQDIMDRTIVGLQTSLTAPFEIEVERASDGTLVLRKKNPVSR